MAAMPKNTAAKKPARGVLDVRHATTSGTKAIRRAVSLLAVVLYSKALAIVFVLDGQLLPRQVSVQSLLGKTLL